MHLNSDEVTYQEDVVRRALDRHDRRTANREAVCIVLIALAALFVGCLIYALKGCTPDPLAIHDVVEVGGEG